MLDETSKLLDAAIEAHQNDDLLKAGELYLELLNMNPHDPDANHNLGILSAQTGNKAEALLFFESALTSNPNVAQYWKSLIGLLIELNRFDDARQSLFQSKEFGFDKKEFQVFEDHLDDLSLTSDKTSNSNLIPEKIFIRLSRLLEKADFEKFNKRLKKDLKSYPTSWQLYELKARALSKQDKPTKAIKFLEKALELNPDATTVAMSLGVLKIELNEFDDAIATFSKLRFSNPHNYSVYYNLGVAFEKKGVPLEAIKSYNKCIQRNPKFTDAYLNLANVYGDLDDIKLAIHNLEKAIDKEPSRFEGHYNLAHYLKISGNFTDAQKYLEHALTLEPNSAQAHHALSSLKKYTPNDPHLTMMQSTRVSCDLDDEASSLLDFAIGKAYEDLGEFEQAYSYFASGNSKRNQLIDYCANENTKYLTEIIRLAPNLKKVILPETMYKSNVSPIFIIGMPRSGTTLVEQILSSHTEISAAGELDMLSNFGKLIHENQIETSPFQLNLFRKTYLQKLEEYSDGSGYVTDKLPNNFKYVSIIKAAFPESKIIHIKRNPRAVCWSNFKHSFSKGSLLYSYDINNLVNYFNDYENLMHFWDTLYPENIHSVKYEILVDQLDVEVGKILNYIGVEFQEACLDPYKNTRSVKTSSLGQVRRKVYSGSSKSWEKYAPFLEGAFDRLSNNSL